jgi:hypothetical protein
MFLSFLRLCFVCDALVVALWTKRKTHLPGALAVGSVELS